MTQSPSRFIIVLAVLASMAGVSRAQSVAFVFPEKDGDSKFARALIERISDRIEVTDTELASAAFDASKVENPFNLTTAESKNVGAAIGCDFFIVFNSAVQRRAVMRGEDYHEAYAVIRLVSSRTGRLAWFEIVKSDEVDPEKAGKKLLERAGSVADQIVAQMQKTKKAERTELAAVSVEEAPDAGSAAAKNLQLPIPYRRIKPEYVTTAALYSVAATVEILVDIDASGAITRTEVTRWAGFGLDESVENAVRSMNWRPAHRNGRPLAMRVLLRYNFKRLEAAK